MSKDYIYYNADINPINALVDTHRTFQPIQFNEDRNDPILPRTGDYEMAITRFQCDCWTLPLFIPVIQGGGNTDVNLTIYGLVVELDDGATTGQSPMTYVVYVPFDSDTSPASLPQTFDNPYYWVQSFKSWCDMVNTTISNAFTAVATSTGIDVSAIKAPWIEYDNLGFRIYFDNTSGGPTVNVYFNSNMRLLFRNFIYSKASFGTALVYKVVYENNHGQNIYVDASDSNRPWLYMDQEEKTTDGFCPISSIAFTTTIPVHGEIVAFPQTVNAMISGVTNPLLTEKIITDISMPLTAGSYDYKGVITYSPNIYRFINLTDNDFPLRSFNYALRWKCKLDGQLYPVLISNNGSASIKVLFKYRESL